MISVEDSRFKNLFIVFEFQVKWRPFEFLKFLSLTSNSEAPKRRQRSQITQWFQDKDLMCQIDQDLALSSHYVFN